MGYTLFTASRYQRRTDGSHDRPIIPLVAVELIVLAIVTYIPNTTLVLLKW